MLKRSDLHEYQETGVAHILDNDKCGLFLDMGLGKTVTTLTAANQLIYEELEIDSILVIAPKRVAENVWSSEIEKWQHLKHLKLSRVIGNEVQRKHALKKKADIYIIGRDNVAWLCGQYGGNMLPFDMWIIDESSSFKNHKSVRFKALRKCQPSAKRIVILTGTPAPNGLLDIWAQIYLLDRGERLGKFITHFRQDYFNKGRHLYSKYKVRKGGEERIYEKIGDICISMKAKDYLELPPRINNFINVNLPENIQKKYNDFEEEQILELLESDKEITAVNAAALSNKLLQFANGAVYDSDRNVHEVHDEKLKAIEEIIEAAQGKSILIAWTYRHDMSRLMSKLAKYDPRELKKEKDIEDWNEGKIQIMLMHPASGGHGLNLQAGGNIIVWFGQTWSLELYQQFNARLDRQGQTEPVIVNHLISVKTIDQDVVNSIKNKANQQESLLQAIKSRIKQYKK